MRPIRQRASVRLLGAMALAAAACFAPADAAAEDRGRSGEGGEFHEQLEGVEYRHVVEPGPQSIHVVSADLSRDRLEVTATVGAEVQGNETVSDMVARLPRSVGRPLAAVNGDYFEQAGEPRYVGTLQGMCIVEREVVAAPSAAAVWIDAAGRPRIGRVAPRLSVTWPDGRKMTLGLNCGTSDFRSEVRSAPVVLYTPRFGRSTRTAEGTREWVLERPAADAPWLPLAAGANLAARVRGVSRSGDAAIPQDGLVVSVAKAFGDGAIDAAVGSALRLEIGCEPDLTGATAAIAGDPLLLADGRLLTKPADSNQPADANRAPRTAVGVAGGRVWLVVVDGRRPGTAVGMSHHELAAFMQRLGCTDALNLDGGGSSTLWFDGRVRNRPSDGDPRPVGNAVVLVRRP
jgi:hypothetical protein